MFDMAAYGCVNIAVAQYTLQAATAAAAAAAELSTEH